MLTYSFENRGKMSLYEYLYKKIKADINKGIIKPAEKLPSKRALAKHLNISTITVENAYNQLVVEGFIYSIPKSGFYVSEIPVGLDFAKTGSDLQKATPVGQVEKRSGEIAKKTADILADFSSNSTVTDAFPFSTWTKLVRETMSENQENLMIKSPSTGIFELRRAIAKFLYEFRGMQIDPDQIVVGAGTEYLYGLIIQLLGRDKKYAVEDPGYQKVARIYQANQVESVHIPLDEHGIEVEGVEKSEADVLHISPSHHFPTGLVTPISRRHELLAWAAKSAERYIIEDDYDSEFRLLGKPIPALESIDLSEKVIYMNTFSKSLTSTIRISYMVLPKSLRAKYKEHLSFYACTVSNFEQYTLQKFIERGYFEKHINRMRNYYRKIRDQILKSIKNNQENKKIKIMEENSGLHFLMKIETTLSDQEVKKRARENGIYISFLSEYYQDQTGSNQHYIVINYSGIEEDVIEEAVERLLQSF